MSVEDPAAEPLSEPEAEPHSLSAESVPSALDASVAEIDRELAGAAPLGARVATEPVLAAGEQVVMFALAGTRYALPVRNVLESGVVPGITAVPNVPKWLRGVTNLRGEIISMLDLRAFLGLPELEQRGSARMLVVRVGAEITTGMVVDSVHGIARVRADQLGATTAPLDGEVAPFVRGVAEIGGELLVVLDLESVFSSPAIRALESL